MRSLWSELRRAAAVLVVVLISLAATNALPRPDENDEVARLRRHFARVDAELAARDVSKLSTEQRARRARNIELLRRYASDGVFPHNHDFAEAIPFFRDEHGTLCAMAS